MITALILLAAYLYLAGVLALFVVMLGEPAERWRVVDIIALIFWPIALPVAAVKVFIEESRRRR